MSRGNIATDTTQLFSTLQTLTTHHCGSVTLIVTNAHNYHKLTATLVDVSHIFKLVGATGLRSPDLAEIA